MCHYTTQHTSDALFIIKFAEKTKQNIIAGTCFVTLFFIYIYIYICYRTYI